MDLELDKTDGFFNSVTSRFEDNMRWLLAPSSQQIRLHRQKRIQVTDVAYGLALFTWIALMVFNSSFFARHLQGIRFVGIRGFCLLLLVFSELTNNERSIGSIVGLGVVALCGYAVTTAHESVLIDNLAFIYCARGKDFRKLARMCLNLTALLVSFVIICSLLGIIQNYSGWSGGRMRSYLGFLYALFPAQYLYLMSCLAAYLLGDHLRVKHVALLLAANCFVYYYTDSRLSFISAAMVLLISWAIAAHHRSHVPTPGGRRINPIIAVCSSLSFIMAALVSIALTYLYDPNNNLMNKLDGVKYLGGRLSIGQRALQAYPVQLFGRELHFTGAALDPFGNAGSFEYYSTIDCLYVRMLVNYGLVFTVLFVLLFTAVTIRAAQEGNIYLLLILVSIALRCTIDNLSFHLQYDTFLLLMGMLMSKTTHKPPEESYG